MLLKIAKACLARALFAAHAFVAVWRIVDIKGHDETYWLFATPLLLLLLEGLVSICHRGGEEHKWFCPCVFLYLCCSIPPLWVLELDWAGRRRGKHVDGLCTNVSVGAERLSPLLGLDLGIKIELPPDLWPKVLEQFLLVNLIVGRWLLPKGELTRYQLSQLLLVYIGMAADIIEILEALKEEAVVENQELPYITLGLWSLSLLQFTTVLTATKGRKPRLGNDNRDKTSWNDGNDPKRCCSCKRLCDLDMWAILTTIILQDGPFLGLRLTLIIRYNVVSYLNIFFTCKNSLMLLLQVYRLSVLCCEGEQDTTDAIPIVSIVDDQIVQVVEDPIKPETLTPNEDNALPTHASSKKLPEVVYNPTKRIKPDHRMSNGTSATSSDKYRIIYGYAPNPHEHHFSHRDLCQHSHHHDHNQNQHHYHRKCATMPRYYPVDVKLQSRKSVKHKYSEERQPRKHRQGPGGGNSHKSATLPRFYGKTKSTEKRIRAEELYKTRSLWDGLQYEVLLCPKGISRTGKNPYASTKF